MYCCDLVSIVIPCYNGSLYLDQSIESALSQSHPNIEVIVVDDGSTDNSIEIAQSYAEHIRLIKQPNSGVSAARNTGIIHAKGEYIMLLDADDILEKEAVKDRLSIIQEEINTGMVVGYYREIDENGILLPRNPRKRSYPAGNVFYSILKQSLPPSGWLIRKLVFKKCGYFDPLIKGGEDWDLLIRCSARFQVKYDPYPNALYRQNPNSASQNILMMYLDSLKVLKKNSIVSNNNFLYWWFAQIGAFYACEFALYRLWKSGSKSNFMIHWFKSILKHPKLLWHSFIVFSALPYRLVKLRQKI